MLTAASHLEYYQTLLWMEMLCHSHAVAYCFRTFHSVRPGGWLANHEQIPFPNSEAGNCARRAESILHQAENVVGRWVVVWTTVPRA